MSWDFKTRRSNERNYRRLFEKFVLLSVLKAYITVGLNYFYTLLSVPLLFSVYQTSNKLSRLLEKFIFLEKNMREFHVYFLPGINFRENGQKSQKSRKFLLAKVSAQVW